MQTKKTAGPFLFFVLSIWGLGVHAQETVPAGGGDASGAGGTVSYTVGQVVYTTNNASSGSVAQGIQQPYEILVVTSAPEAGGFSLTCAAYPNPTAGILNLRIGDFISETMFYSLSDEQGRILKTKKIRDAETPVLLSGYPEAIYFLTVTNGDKKIKTFRIVHN